MVLKGIMVVQLVEPLPLNEKVVGLNSGRRATLGFLSGFSLNPFGTLQTRDFLDILKNLMIVTVVLICKLVL